MKEKILVSTHEPITTKHSNLVVLGFVWETLENIHYLRKEV